MELNGWLKTNAPQRADEVNTFVKTLQPSYNSLTADQMINSALNDEKWLALRQTGSARFKSVNLQNKDQFIFTYKCNVLGGSLTIYLDSLKGQIYKIIPIDTSGRDWRVAKTDLPPQTGVHDVYVQYNNPNLKKLTDGGMMFDWLSFASSFPGKGLAGFENAEKQFWALLNAKNLDKTPVCIENPADMHRKTFVFERGNWLSHGAEVQPDVPHSLNPFPKDAPKDRRGLAMWLTDKKNPLTARTYVNRIWEQLFGVGLAETLEDLGTQGIAPTHPELLDYLSYNFMNGMNWRTKTLIKTIVMSATYQQSSTVTPELQAKDPQNKLYARAPRVRLSAEQIRDQTLAVSGLLLDSLYGKSVYPFQPDGVWSTPYNGAVWKLSAGKQAYRRAIYTYWKRSSPFPSMLTFDGVNREVCVSRRIRTNTPLQALVTLNDSTYLVAAVAMAKNISRNVGEVSTRIVHCYATAMGQPITKEKQAVLEKLYQTALQQFQSNNKKEKAKIPSVLTEQTPEIAALAIVANAILNLDEFVNKS